LQFCSGSPRRSARPNHSRSSRAIRASTTLRVIEVEGKYVAFGAGEQGIYRGAIRVRTLSDGVNWTDTGAIGKGAPQWGMDTLGYQPLNVWAPSISSHGGVFYLYYSLSSFGGHVSAIGLMTNASLDPEKPGQGWRDQGPILTSGAQDDFSAIDPFRIDASDGRAFLAFGSSGQGSSSASLPRKPVSSSRRTSR
jgi:arabinan endo-1,5-alpha-L-arabinosidase